MAEHWCKEHQTVCFKRGKMRNFAHPIVDEDGEDTGMWCNENTQDAKPQSQEPQAAQTDKMSKDDWKEREQATRKSIERQTALNAAVRFTELVGAKEAAPGSSATGRTIATAKIFEAYLEGKGVTPAKSSLVEEAKKMGGVDEEIEEPIE